MFIHFLLVFGSYLSKLQSEQEDETWGFAEQMHVDVGLDTFWTKLYLFYK